MNNEQQPIFNDKVDQVEFHLQQIMYALEIPWNKSTEGTPKRIAKMWVNEVFSHRNNHDINELDSKMKLFENVDQLKEMVVVKDIEFHSMCEHHWLPFSGKITVAYVPFNNIIGLSKIPRVVKYFSQKPQLQERLVQEIGQYLTQLLDPYYIVVQAEATHGCVMCRGVESDCSTDTMYTYSDLNNTYEETKAFKQEYYNRVRR